jgi:hypothetical protein
MDSTPTGKNRCRSTLTAFHGAFHKSLQRCGMFTGEE